MSRSSALTSSQRRLRLHPGLTLLAAAIWWIVVVRFYYAQLWRGSWYGGDSPPGLFLDPSLPALREAVLRAGISIGGATLLMAAALTVGYGIAKLAGWRYNSRLESIPYAASLGIGVYAYAGLALATVGLYRPAVLIGITVVPALIGVIVLVRRGMRSAFIPPFSLKGRKGIDNGAALQPALQSLLPRRANWLWAACVAAAVLCAAVAALAPEREYDALWYHLGYPQLYLQTGSLVDLPYDYVSLYPMTWELWFGYGLAFGQPVAAKLLHFATLPLTALITAALTRRFAPGASPWLAAALFCCVPIVIWEASTAYIDLALALHFSLALYGLLRYLEQRSAQWFLLGAINLGMAVATKHLALFALAICGLGLLVLLWRRERRILPTILPAAALGILAVGPAIPWYLRAFLASGNPVFPELYGIFGAPPERWDATTLQGLKGFLDAFGPQTLGELLVLPWHMTIHAAAYHGTLGPIFLLALPLLALRLPRGNLGLIGLFCLAYLALWASPVSSFQMRFIVPIVPFLAVLAAAAIRHGLALCRRLGGKLAGRAALIALTILLLLNLPFFTALHEADRVGFEGWMNHALHSLPIGVVVGGEHGNQYLRRNVASFNAWRYANANLPGDARVLTWAGGDQLYVQRDWLWVYATVIRPAIWARPGQEQIVLDTLAAQGVTHLLLDKSTSADWDQQAITQACARDNWYELLYEDRSYALYAVRWDRLEIASCN